MAIYHLSAKPVQRSAGRSAVAAAAYRSRSTLHDERQGMTFSYLSAVDLVHAEIVGFAGDRGTLWNMAEAMERRKDATTAREYEIALPHELDRTTQIELARDFAAWLNETQGCVVDYAIHSGEGKNPHVHMLTTTRAVDALGTMSNIKIPREWSDRKRKDHGLPCRKAELQVVREQWSRMANATLSLAGVGARIDHRSLADQGIDRLPTSHLGPAAASMEYGGLKTRAGDHNRMIDELNLERQSDCHKLRNHQSEARKLTDQLAAIDCEIESIRNEAAHAPSRNGAFEIGPAQAGIEYRSKKESSKFRSGVSVTVGERFKAKLFLQTWNFDLEPSILRSLRWVDVDAKALTLKTGEQIVDRGNSVSLSTGSNEGIAAAIAMAEAKSWQTVQVRGSDDFQVRSALALRDSGIEPELTSEIAKSLFADEIQKRDRLKLTPEPEETVDTDALKYQVQAVIDRIPLRATRTLYEDPKKLEKWVRARWDELVRNGEPEGLSDAFIELTEHHAYIAGYSVGSVQKAGIDGELSKGMPGYVPSKPPPNPKSEPKSGLRRTWSDDLSCSGP